MLSIRCLCRFSSSTVTSVRVSVTRVQCTSPCGGFTRSSSITFPIRYIHFPHQKFIGGRARAAAANPATSSHPFSSSSATTPKVDPYANDRMTRYPGFSPGGILRGLDYFGTAVFAMSGTITAGVAGLDLLGCVIVATITAIGGGTVRDLLIGNVPFWNEEWEYVLISVVASLLTFGIWWILEQKGWRDDDAVLLWADAFGVGAFCVIGAQNGIRKGLPFGLCMMCGMFTATFGGLIRDVLCRRPVRILHSHAEVYATTALGGAAVYLVARKMNAPMAVRIAAGVSSAIALRYYAWSYNVKLPLFPGKHQEIAQQSEGKVV